MGPKMVPFQVVSVMSSGWKNGMFQKKTFHLMVDFVWYNHDAGIGLLQTVSKQFRAFRRIFTKGSSTTRQGYQTSCGIFFIQHYSTFEISTKLLVSRWFAACTSCSLGLSLPVEFTEIHHHRPSPMKDAMLVHTSVLSPQLRISQISQVHTGPWYFSLHRGMKQG